MKTETKKARGRLAQASFRGGALPAMVLAALFAAAFLIRAAACSLPALQPRERLLFQDETGDPYLREMDSYFYLRHVEEMQASGEIAWSVRRGEDPLIGAREAGAEGFRNPLGLSVLAYAVWKMLGWIPGLTLSRIAIWLGPVAGSLAVIPAFCFVRRRTNLAGALAAGIWVGCAIPFVHHTHAGFFDTDLLLAVLPLAGITGMIRCLEETGWKRQAAYALGSSLAFGGLYLCWSAWYAYALLGVAGAALTMGMVWAMPGRFLRNAGRNREGSAEENLMKFGRFPGDAGPDRRREVLRGGCLAIGGMAAILLILGGADVLRDLSGMADLFRSIRRNSGDLPALHAYTSELQGSPLLPGGSPVNLLKANLNSVLGMIGGAMPALLAAAAVPLGILAGRWTRAEKTGNVPEQMAADGTNAGAKEPGNAPDQAAADETASESTNPGNAAAQTASDGTTSESTPPENTPEQAPADGTDTEAEEPGNASDQTAPTLDPLSRTAEICFLGIWAAAGIYLAATGNRFGEIAALPVGLLAGLAVGRLFGMAGRILPARRKIAALAACGVLLAAAVFPVLKGAVEVPKLFAPMVTDSSAGAMDYIRENTPEDTAILGWWDDGYYMEYQARRRTLADGGSENGALNWLLAKALLTDDPEMMAGIARMLNESGTEAWETLTAAGMEPGKAADLLLRIVRTDREGAEAILEEAGADPGLAAKTHPADSNGLVLVLGTDLMGKIQALSYFADWDPATGSPGEPVLSMTSTGSVALEAGAAELAMAARGYVLRLREAEDGTIRAEYTQDGGAPQIPCRTVVWENGIRIQDEITGTSDLAAVLFCEDGRYCGMLCTERLCDSMLFRMLAGEDQNLPGATRLGTWYGDCEMEPCAAQRRIRYATRPAWARQVWRINLE